MLKEDPEIAVDLTEEEAFYVTGTASRRSSNANCPDSEDLT